jgi:K319L-like, PKD domain/Bacterial Ig domain/Right handed beta helix region
LIHVPARWRPAHRARNAVEKGRTVRRRSWLGSLAVAVAVLATPSVSLPQGSTRYVNATDATCQSHTPCYSTIQAAVTAALAADHLVIQPGTYIEQVNVTRKNSGTGATEADRIVIEADPSAADGSVVLRGSVSQCTSGYAVRIQQSKFITLRGLTITGAGGQAVALLGGSSDNQAIHLERLRIFGNGSSSCDGGITVNRGNAGTLIANSLIYGNGRNGVTFIDADGGPQYLIGNTIHRNAWSGVNVARNHETWLINNAITGNGTGTGSTGGRFGVTREGSTNPQPTGIHLLSNLVCGNRLGEINGPALDASDSGNLTPTGIEGAGVTASPGCEIPANVYAHLAGADNLTNTADDDCTPATGSPLVDRGMDPRTLGLGVDGVLEADFTDDGVRPHNATGTPTPRFDIGAIELRPANHPPVANAGVDRTVIAGTNVTLDGAASSDPDDDPLTFSWTQTSGPSVTLTGASTATPSFTTPAVMATTALVFQLTVNDGQASASASVRITVVQANRPPVLDPIGNKTVQVGATLTWAVSASDPDGDPLTFSAAPLPPNATFDPTTRTFAYNSGAGQVGSVSVTFAVSDGRGGTASETVVITVTAALRVTITSPAAGATVPAGALLVRGTLQSATTDVGVAVNGVPAALQGASFVALVSVTAETTTLTATATAADGGSAGDTIALSVSAVLTPVSSLRVAPSSGVAPLGVRFTVSGVWDISTVALDIDGDGTVDFQGSTLEGAQFTYTAPGLFVPTVTVTDSAGQQTTAQAVVQVFDPAGLEVLLQARWSALRAALQRGDVDGAVSLFANSSRDAWRDQLTALADAGALPLVAADLPAIRLSRVLEQTAEYDLRAVRSGTQYSFLVVFVIDEDGVWRLWAF